MLAWEVAKTYASGQAGHTSRMDGRQQEALAEVSIDTRAGYAGRMWSEGEAVTGLECEWVVEMGERRTWRAAGD